MDSGLVLDQGWAWMVMVASLGAHIVNGCFLYCIGIIHNALLEHFDESITLTSWTGSIMVGLISLSGPISSFLINRYNCRVSTMIGGLLLTAGCFVSAFVPSIGWVILFFGFIGGIGSGLTYSASVVVVGFNFEKRRNLASGIAVTGCALGTFIFPPILTFAEMYHGYRGLFIVLAAISVHQCLFGALFRPSHVECKHKRLKLNKKETELFSKIRGRAIRRYLTVMFSKFVMLMCMSVFCYSVGVYLVFLHLPYYAISKNTSLLDASFLLTIAGICGCISRPLTGLVGSLEKVEELLLYSSSFGILGISTHLFPIYSFSYGGQVIYAITLGFFSGNCYSIFNAINISFVGVENLATVYVLEMFFGGIGSFIGPLLAGIIVDSGGTYEQSFIFAGSTIFMGAVFGILTKCVKKPENEDIIGGTYKPQPEMKVYTTKL